jgi:hypothetical protein
VVIHLENKGIQEQVLIIRKNIEKIPKNQENNKKIKKFTENQNWGLFNQTCCLFIFP